MELLDSYWWLEAVIGILLLVVLQLLSKKVLREIQKKNATLHSNWKGRLSSIAGPPIALIVWAVGIVFVIDVVSRKFGFLIVINYLNTVREVAVVAALAWLALRWKKAIHDALLLDKTRHIDATTVEIAFRFVTIAIFILTALIVMQIFGIHTAPLLAFGGIGAASLGFAGKDVIANFCSGIMLHITRPFVIGDQIYLPEKGLEGNIEEIGWFRTSMRDKERRAVYLPNNFFSTQLLINSSRMTHRRIKEKIEIKFEHWEGIPELVEKLKEAIGAHPKIDKSSPVLVHFTGFGGNGCEIDIDAYSLETRQADFDQVEQEILLRVQQVLVASKVELGSMRIEVQNM